jgi:hypothetical protein
MQTPLAFSLRAGLTRLLLFSSLAGCLSGCYTQLYTQGYATRSLDAPPEAVRSGPLPTDSTLSDTALDAEAAAGDTLSPRTGTVIVNNYYRESPYYRGYLVDEWEYPSISLGFYSSRFRDYNRAYWWNDPGYHRRYYDRGYHDRYPGGYPSGSGGSGGTPGSGQGSGGSYQSGKRLYSQPTPHVTKGRATPSAAPAPAPAPKQAADPGAERAKDGQNPGASQPAADGGSSSASDKDDSPRIQKGRRH